MWRPRRAGVKLSIVGLAIHVDARDEQARILDELAVAIGQAAPSATLTRQLVGRLCVFAGTDELREDLARRAEAWLVARGIEVEVERLD